MFYTINFIFILIISFSQNPHYFNLLFSVLKEKIKYYSSETTRFLFTYFWLAEIVANSKPAITSLATKSHLIRELPQHCEMMGIAFKMGQIWCPARKGCKHDGCFFDPSTGKVIQSVQFKLKDEGAGLSSKDLEVWIEKYIHLDILDIGFQSPKDFELHKGLIYQMDEIQRSLGSKLRLTCKDYSLYKSEGTCSPDIRDWLEIQSEYNAIVLKVNKDMIDVLGEITNFPML